MLISRYPNTQFKLRDLKKYAVSFSQLASEYDLTDKKDTVSRVIGCLCPIGLLLGLSVIV